MATGGRANCYKTRDTSYYVRGGNRDQNLLMIDEAPIYNPPFHLFGFSGNLGPYASTLTLEGPVVKEKASFLVSERLSTLNWLNYLMDETGSFSLWFYDINARINAQVSPRDRLFLTG